MKIYAIYRMYYGEDFIEESIESIINYIDKVFVFAPQNAFWDVHKGRVDKSLQIVKATPLRMIYRDKIVIIENDQHYRRPRNQFTDLYNTYIHNAYAVPDAVMCIEHDMVWNRGELHGFIEDFKATDGGALNSNQIEFWHNDHWILPSRERFSCILHHLNSEGKMVETGLSGNVGSKMRKSTARVD